MPSATTNKVLQSNLSVIHTFPTQLLVLPQELSQFLCTTHSLTLWGEIDRERERRIERETEREIARSMHAMNSYITKY